LLLAAAFGVFVPRVPGHIIPKLAQSDDRGGIRGPLSTERDDHQVVASPLFGFSSFGGFSCEFAGWPPVAAASALRMMEEIAHVSGLSTAMRITDS
jgi:hypothetical protein